MQDLLMEARLQTEDWRYPHVGDLLFVFFMVACHLNPKEHIRLWHYADQLVGYAVLGEDPSFDCQVLPKYAWRGIKNEAMVWADAKLAELRKRDAQLWGKNLVTGSRQNDLKRIAFLEKLGFQPGGKFSEVNMLCSLNGLIPEPVLPAGYQVRSVAEMGEISNRADAQRDVWHPWTVGNVSVIQIGGLTPPAGLSAAARTGSSLVFLFWTAPRDSRIIGYHVYRFENDGRTVVPVGSSFEQDFADLFASLDTKYQYAVTSYNDLGEESALSAKVEVIPNMPKIYLPVIAR